MPDGSKVDPVDEMLDREARQFVARLRTKKPRGVHYDEAAPRRKRGAPEREAQRAVVGWLRKAGCIVQATFTEQRGDAKTVEERARFGAARKKSGATTGFPDLTVILPCGRIVLIEMKAAGTGRLSEAQRELHAELEARGVIVVVGTCVWSVQDALRARGVVIGLRRQVPVQPLAGGPL